MLRRLTPRPIVVIAAVALAAAACSGDDDAAPTTTFAPPITSDTLFVTSTTDAPPATAPPTLATTTNATPAETTTVPTTTAAIGADEQAVIDALVASWTAFNEIKLDPFDDEKLRAVVETHRGAALDAVVDIVQQRRLENRRSLTHPEFPTEIVPIVESLVIDGLTASIEFCWVNSNILVEIGANEDGSDRVVDDSISVSLERETFEFLDGAWVKVGGSVLKTADGALCDAL